MNLTNIIAWIRHNLFTTIAIGVAIIFCTTIYGCNPHTKSLLDPSKKVTAEELTIEYNSQLAVLEAQLEKLQESYKVRTEDLARIQSMRDQLVQIGLVCLDGGTINPVGLATAVLGALGIGLAVDNRMKDKVIKTRTNDIKDITAVGSVNLVKTT